MERNRSFLKWVGSKQRVVNQIIAHLPTGRRLIEPFVGAGNIFINTDFDGYLISDINRDLIGVYTCLQLCHERLIERVTDIFNGDMDYYDMRDQFNREQMCPIERSAYFIYLMRNCFNGVCRYNKSGHFNVPQGDYKNVYLPINELLCFAYKIRKTYFSIICEDFSETIKLACARDVIYCDPPYLPVSSTANFSSYYSNPFGYTDHERLAQDLCYAVKRGASAVVSNSDCDEARYIFRDFQIHEITAPRSCAASGHSRGKANEIICVLTPDMLNEKCTQNL